MNPDSKKPYTYTYTLPCHGRSKKTGKRVGVRHRWNGGHYCEWCGRTKDHVFYKAKP